MYFLCYWMNSSEYWFHVWVSSVNGRKDNIDRDGDRGVVREILRSVVRHGLVGYNKIYNEIEFQTSVKLKLCNFIFFSSLASLSTLLFDFFENKNVLHILLYLRYKFTTVLYFILLYLKFLSTENVNQKVYILVKGLFSFWSWVSIFVQHYVISTKLFF